MLLLHVFFLQVWKISTLQQTYNNKKQYEDIFKASRQGYEKYTRVREYLQVVLMRSTVAQPV